MVWWVVPMSGMIFADAWHDGLVHASELLIFTRIDAEAFREDKAVDDRVEFPSTDAHMVKKHVTRDDATKEDGSLERMHVMVSIKTG